MMNWCKPWLRAMPGAWARTIPILTLSLWSAAALQGQGLEAALRGVKTQDARYQALLRFAASHPQSRDGALALFAAAAGYEASERSPEEALRQLRAAKGSLPKLADYVAYHAAQAQFSLGNFAAVAEELQPLWQAQPPSPLLVPATLLSARAAREAGNAQEAVRLLKARAKELPQPAGDLLLGECLRSANDLRGAVSAFRRVWARFPTSQEAGQAQDALSELAGQLGELYPPPTPEIQLERADRLAQLGELRAARNAYEALGERLSGPARDLARVRMGVMDVRLYANISGYNYLNDLDVAWPEADAERLHYMLEAARRLERDDYIAAAVQRLEHRRDSEWRMRALISAGNHYLIRNEPERYLPFYGACSEAFPDEPRAEYCYWKVVWNEYVNRRPQARQLLRQHLERYPGSSRASAALYFLGRLAESNRDTAEAKAYFQELVRRFPGYFYADLANRRLTDPELFKALPDTAVVQFLRGVIWPVPRKRSGFQPTSATLARLERAGLLESAGLDDLAESELRFGARTEEQGHILAMHLARRTTGTDAAFRALRIMKSFVPGYLSIAFEDAPEAFWRLLYPLPWRTALERYARQNDLDPYVVAGLIRQESEFNPRALSSANAYGLTQVVPSTGRQLLRQSRRRFRASVLFNPELNLRLGTTYLRHVLNSHGGSWERALAAYNGGPSRVQNWINWAEYREPAEFIETIPFSETREYVMAVLRNAEMYRRLYAKEPVAEAANGSRPTAKKAAPKKPASKKRR